jgi:tetratricopeptide (TPR) repeat protein
MMRPATLLLAAFVMTSAGCAAPAVTVRAQALVRQHREADAVALLRARLHAAPDDLAARRLLVRVLAFAGDVAGARAEVAELFARMPDGSPTPYLELGHALELAHRYDEALDAYDAAAAAAPASPEGPREGGMRCAHWGEAEAARDRLEEAVRRGSRDAETWHTLGLVRLKLGDFDGAAGAYREGAAADPARADCWLGLATVAVARGDAQGALDAYDRLLARRPKFAPAELGRAWALAKLGRTDEARSAIDHAEELGAPEANVARQRRALASGGPE